MKKYYCFAYRDAANAYVRALDSIGCTRVAKYQDADFVLYDHEDRPEAVRAFANKPVFIYPHTPYSWFIWDGIVPIARASANFVCGESAKFGLESFGYPNRIEVCGFPRGPVLPFCPTRGTKLLFAVAHPVSGDRRFPQPEHYAQHMFVMDWIVANKKYFSEIRVRYAFELKDNGFEKYAGEPGIQFERAKMTVADGVASRDWADIIIAAGTFGYLAIAQGKPTLIYGYKNSRYCTRAGYVKNQNLYQSIMEFPYYAEDMTAEQILAFRDQPDPKIEAWKIGHMGGNFDADKFISVVREFI